MNSEQKKYWEGMFKLNEYQKGKIWVERVPLKFYGFQCGTRMSVIKLANNKLFIHSPVKITKKVKKKIDKLGDVSYIVSPTNIHHVFMEEWQKAYPKAKIYASPGLEKKRPDLKFTATLTDTPQKEWAKEIDQVIIWGHPWVQEVAFFHKKSKTLILADMLEYATKECGLGLRIFSWIFGMYNKATPPTDFKFTFKDKEAGRKSIEKILKWDFNQIIIAHGPFIETNSKEVFRQAFQWLFK